MERNIRNLNELVSLKNITYWNCCVNLIFIYTFQFEEWGEWECGKPCAVDPNDKKCKETCTRKCMFKGSIVPDHKCNHLPGGSKKFGKKCHPCACVSGGLSCPDDDDKACNQCHQKALDEAKLKTGTLLIQSILNKTLLFLNS